MHRSLKEQMINNYDMDIEEMKTTERKDLIIALGEKMSKERKYK